MATPLPYFQSSSGDPFERGRQLGAASADYVHGSVAVYQETFAHYTGLSWNAVREHAAEYRDPITEYDEKIMREIDGIAAGAGLGVEDVLAVNARTEIMFGLAVLPPPECTSFYVGPTASTDGHVLMGQNWDWRTRCSETTILAEVDQGADGPAFVMLAEAGLVGKLGFNAAGIGVAANTLVADLDDGRRDVPYHVILRGILNSRTIEEAVAAVVRAQRAASANYVIGSAAGVGVDLETGPGGIESVYMVHPVDDVIGHANNFTCSIDFTDRGNEKWLDSGRRVVKMNTFLQDRRGALSRETIAEALRDHDGQPDSICRHPNEADHPIEQVTSVASWIIDLTERVADVCAGPPCSTEYQELRPAFAAVPAGAVR